mgnify:CR=1 FL=1
MSDNTITVHEGEHATLGASNAERWMNCPGSVTAEQGLPDTDSVFALEGTAAHTLAEMAFVHKRDPDLWDGTEIRVERVDGTHHPVIVNLEMIEAIRLYVTIILRIAKTATKVWAERKFDLAPLRPPLPMFGTSDFAAYIEDQQMLEVVDLKYGKGVVKVATDNPQVRMYALGVWLEIAKENYAMAQRIRWIRMTIVQPRVYDEDGEPHISEEVISLSELKQWGKLLLDRARRTQESTASRKAGDWCVFCKAKATCQTYRQVALAAAQMEFSDLVEGVEPKPPTEFTPDELANALEALPMLESWCNALRAFAMHEIDAGRDVPRHAKKPKTKHRKWANERQALNRLKKLGLPEKELLTTPKLRTPAQVVAAAKARKINIPETLIVRPESTEFVLCSADDPKALRSGVTDFEPLEDEE